jgi:2-polyprenyl-3-methyl-5-hydroxy-6-metoxy-1,4-benzoquinol methylase
MHGGRAAEELSGCTSDDVRESWSQVAHSWSAFVRSGADEHRDRLHGPALLEACGSVSGLRTLDLGCGEGWCCRALASRGSRVVGVDLSDAMIGEARRHADQDEHPVEYHVMDAVGVDRHPWPGPFDLVTACMSLQSMPDPARALVAARRVLSAKGRLVCSIPHPLTHMVGGQYFKSLPYRVWWDSDRSGRGWWTIRWCRPQSEYVAMLRDAGFVVHDLLEPHASRSDVVEHPRLVTAAEIPRYLIVVASPERPPQSD